MIWVIGSNGMLGTEISRCLTKNKLPWIGTNSEIDITDYQQLENFEKNIETSSYFPSNLSHNERKVKWIINCAAYTNVDNAEENQIDADKINNKGAANIARLCRNIGAKLIHVSTDFVFDGKTNVPYTEESEPNPLNEYGKTKLDGENAIKRQMNTYYIIRTSWLFSREGTNFVKTMLNLFNDNTEINVVKNQTGSPTYCEDLANCILKLIEKCDGATSLFGKNSAPNFGIYNFANTGKTSWFNFAETIYKQAKKHGLITNDCKILPCSADDFQSKAIRPEFSALDTSKISKSLKLKIPTWENALERMLKGK